MANNITHLSSMRLIDARGIVGCAMSALLSALYGFGIRTRFAPFTGVDQGRIVSTSRGSPPPKRR